MLHGTQPRSRVTRYIREIARPPQPQKPRWPYGFEGRIRKFGNGSFNYMAVYLPSSLEDQLPLKQHPRLRIRGVIGSAEFAGTWQPTGGGWYLMVSKALLRRSGYRFGELAMVRFRIDDQNAVDVPEPLLEALKADRAAKRLWDLATPGKRRGLAYYVSSAKLPATVDKRIKDVFYYLVHGELPGKPAQRSRAKRPPE